MSRAAPGASSRRSCGGAASATRENSAVAGGAGWGCTPSPSLATTRSVSFWVARAVAEVETRRQPSSVTKKM
jgi:hypothetical protein